MAHSSKDNLIVTVADPTAELNADAEFRRQYDNLMRTIGQCIMAWADVENSLCVFFGTQIGADQRLAWALWDAVISFDAKLGLLNATLAHTLKDEELLAIWNRLSNKISKTSRKRHEIAHGSLIHLNDRETKLVPYGSVRAVTDLDRPRFGAKELEEKALSFLEVVRAIRWFEKAVSLRLNTPSAVLPPAPHLVREIQTTIAQTPKGK